MADDDEDAPAEVELPITGELDLHTFHPKDLTRLLNDYIDAAAKKGLTELRIVHGKGTGVLRARVEAVLSRNPRVISFGQAPANRGGWGATLVTLRPPG